MLRQGHYTLTSTGPQATAHLAQTMTLLNMNTQELMQQLETALAENPALELDEERRCPTCHRVLGSTEICPVCSQPKTSDVNDTVVFLSPLHDTYHDRMGSRVSNEYEDMIEDEYSVKTETLPSYIITQISIELNGIEHQIAEHLVQNLDENGFLAIEIFEIARYFHVSISVVERVRKMIQHCDPLGLASRTSTEAMQIQLEVLAQSQEIPEIVNQVLTEEGMSLLYHRKMDQLAKILKVKLSDIEEAIQFIASNLNPFPTHSYWGTCRTPAKTNLHVYHQPDIIIHYLNDDPENGLSVEVFMPYLWQPKINPEFRAAMAKIEGEKKEAWQKDYEKAALLVKCLQQRAYTILRLMQYLVKNQEAFILHGAKYLKPVTRAKVAEILDVHESTISRAVANKTVELQNGKIIPLSAFFSQNLGVRSVLCEIISKEKTPLSDSKLTKELQKQGYSVARRTVAKYRSMEGILPAHLRKSSQNDKVSYLRKVVAN
ncbi:MAG: hypothetical protein K8R40_04015 [Anaerolineaceae bacterium]|nr:hypothetical protein [Anaerolineaceae bacterium]